MPLRRGLDLGRGERRIERDVGPDVQREGHDRDRCLEPAAVGERDRHAVVGAGHRGDHRTEADVEAGRHRIDQLLRAVGDELPDVRVRVDRRVVELDHVPQERKNRRALEARAAHRGEERAEVVGGLRRRVEARDPILRRDVERRESLTALARERLRGALERLGQRRAGELFADPIDRRCARLSTLAADPPDRVGLRRRAGLGDVDPVACDLRGERGLRLPRDEHPAVLGPDIGAGDLSVPGTAADPIARLEHDDAMAGLREVTRRGDAREPGSDDDDVGVHGARRLLETGQWAARAERVLRRSRWSGG
jgi:hypothetical protein